MGEEYQVFLGHYVCPISESGDEAIELIVGRFDASAGESPDLPEPAPTHSS